MAGIVILYKAFAVLSIAPRGGNRYIVCKINPSERGSNLKRVVITGPSKCGLEDVAEPTVAANYAKVKIFAAPLCTEYHSFLEGPKRPLGGHEAAGEVVEVGPCATGVKVGDRVVVMPQNSCGVCELCTSGEHIYCRDGKDWKAICGCETGRQTYAEYCIQQDWLLYHIPDDVSYDHASMACCGMGPAFNAMQVMNVTATDTVLVSGLGPVGLGAVVIARFRGARVLGVDMSPYRTELAKRMGVEAVIDPSDEEAAIKKILDLTDGKGVDKSVETSGAAAAPNFLVKASRRLGKIASVAWRENVTVSGVTFKGISIHGCWHWNHQRDGVVMMRTIRGAASLIDMMITHAFPFSEVQEALEVRASNECGKIILHPWGDQA